MNQNEIAAIDRLVELAIEWPDTLILISWAGNLCVVDRRDGEVIKTIFGITNDGGDFDAKIENGISYIRYLAANGD